MLAYVKDGATGNGIAGGALDFAGGTVVHISSGVSALVCALVMGKRLGYGSEPMPPHNLTYTALGAAMLWVGWFGFNAGSELAADGLAASAFCVTHFRRRGGRAGLGRHGMDHPRQAERARCGLGRGGRAGLHHAGRGLRAADAGDWRWAWRPASSASWPARSSRRRSATTTRSTPSACTASAARLGAILTGVFATGRFAIRRWSAMARPVGLIEGSAQLAHRPARGRRRSPGCLPRWPRSSCSRCSTLTMGLRVTRDEELQGLDLSQHGEEGYIFI